MSQNKKYINSEQFVEESLKREPEFFLPDDFANKMALQVEKRMAWSSYLKEFFIYFGAIVGIMVTALAVIFIFNTESWMKLEGVVLSNLTIIIGASIIVLFVLFTDKVLLRYFSHRARLQKVD